MTGDLRLVFPTLTWEDYVTLAFDEICQYGTSSVQVLHRLLSASDSALEGKFSKDKHVVNYLFFNDICFSSTF
jgi:uncharacterized membrane protein